MMDSLFNKVYETEGATNLSVDPSVLLLIFTVVSLAYVLYSVASITTEDGALFYYEKYVFPVINFYLLGCCIGQSGYGCIFGVVDGTNDGSNKIKYTLSNIKDWHFAKYALIAGVVCILFIAFVQLVTAKNFARFARDILFMLALAVFGFCVARYAMTVNGFLLKLLFLPTSALAFICQFTWPIALILWFLPTRVVAAMNRASEERERRAASVFADKTEDADEVPLGEAPTSKFPARVTDDRGENWHLVNDSGDHAEYECRRTGARRTFWYTGDGIDFPSGWGAY